MCPSSGQDLFNIRRKRLWSELDMPGQKAVLFLKHEDIYYLTGFCGKDSNSMLVLSPGKAYLLVNFIYYEDASASVDRKSTEVVLYRGDRIKKASQVISSLEIKQLLLEEAKINHSDFNNLLKELKIRRIHVKPCNDLMGSLRGIKDKTELEAIEKACRITDSVFADILAYGAGSIKRYNEISLANEMERLCIKYGGQGRSFDFVIATGQDSSRPHYCSSRKRISRDILLMDFGTVYEKYCSDMTRTVFLGSRRLNDKMKDMYEVVLEAQLIAIDKCREGVRCDELDGMARKYIDDAGYGKYFGHGLGHGVGLEVHEAPYITRKSRTILKENMVVTMEPGIYIPGLGGVRIEDMVVVGKKGCRNLYRAKKDFTFIA